MPRQCKAPSVQLRQSPAFMAEAGLGPSNCLALSVDARVVCITEPRSSQGLPARWLQLGRDAWVDS